jgi:CheY-like chemotaxis protein
MSKKILLADDSLTIQKVVELTFSDSDYQLVCVSNGQRALERLRDDRPDLILADVVMPEKNGYEVCEAIKGNPETARIPVVLLSGTFEPFDRQRAERIGADAIVSKPFDSQQLLAQVEALLDRAPSQREPAPERRPEPPRPPEPAPAEPEPFDLGFSAEDFTASVRMPPAGAQSLDPFEEEYARGDVDSAIEEFEKAPPEILPPLERPAPREASAPAPSQHAPEAPREPLSRWLVEEPEKAAAPSHAAPAPEPTSDLPTQEIPQMRLASEPVPLPPLRRPDTTQEVSGLSEPSEPFDAPTGAEAEEQEEALPPTFPAAAAAFDEEPETVSAEVPREIEMLAQTASIPELNQMLSSVSKNGNELSAEQIDRIASRVIEKLSDRIIREIAWEVIPDMAEIVIKKRIKELEAGIE